MDTQVTSMHTFPLGLAATGEWVRVMTVTGGKNMLRRLLAMGIIDGSELEIVHRHTDNSGVVVRYGDTRWAIGHGMAHKIIVLKINPPDVTDNSLASV